MYSPGIPPEKFCIRCGETEPMVDFRSVHALKCTECDLDPEKDRTEYHRLYHKARGRATRRLILMYQAEFDVFLAHEHEQVKKEERARLGIGLMSDAM